MPATIPTEHAQALLAEFCALSPGQRRRIAEGAQPQETEDMQWLMAASTPAEIDWFNAAIAITTPGLLEPTAIKWHRANTGRRDDENDGDDHEIDAPERARKLSKWDR